MVCNNCSISKHDKALCKFCNSLIKTDNAEMLLEIYKFRRSNNIKIMTSILIGINLFMAILFACLTFVTEGYTKYCLLLLSFICLIIILVTQIIKLIKLYEINDKKHKSDILPAQPENK